MIKDHINNAHRYDDMHPNFRSVLEILQSLNLDALQPGHIELDGKYVYININTTNGQSKELARLEAHRQYIDIQMPLSGKETFGVKATNECLNPMGEFDSERDIVFYNDSPTEYFTLDKGEFIIFFPDDAHAPCIDTDENHMKLVVKISVEPNKEKPTL
jgi:YhcH/YjgK/YiaL family protein